MICEFFKKRMPKSSIKKKKSLSSIASSSDRAGSASKDLAVVAWLPPPEALGERVIKIYKILRTVSMLYFLS